MAHLLGKKTNRQNNSIVISLNGIRQTSSVIKANHLPAMLTWAYHSSADRQTKRQRTCGEKHLKLKDMRWQRCSISKRPTNLTEMWALLPSFGRPSGLPCLTANPRRAETRSSTLNLRYVRVTCLPYLLANWLISVAAICAFLEDFFLYYSFALVLCASAHCR